MNTILSLDVSKKWLDACLYNAEIKPVYERFSNDDKGHKALLDYLAHAPVKLIVCEPTGDYERDICEQLHTNNLPVHQVNTYSFSAFSRAVNRCKTDKQDAFKLAYYADAVKLKANYSYQVAEDRLKRQQQRREELVAMLSNEKKRLHHSQAGIDKESIEEVIDFLEKKIKDLATKLVSCLPELGDKSYSSNQLAAIVGIAPYAADSGNKNGKRFIRGGRKIPRDALYMAVLVGKKYPFTGVADIPLF